MAYTRFALRHRLAHHSATGAQLNVNTKCCAIEISWHRNVA